MSKKSKILVLFYSFIDNVLSISQEKSFEKTNSFLFCSYNIISSLFEQFGLVIEYEKAEIFHFSRLYGLFNLSPLDLSYLRDSALYPKDSWHYLRFILDRKLLFH